MRLIRRVLYFFQQRRQAADLAEEMEFHRQMAEQETGDRHEANRRMGATMLAQESARAIWLAPWLESVLQDLRYAARSLAKQPGFTALTLLALGLGIGLNTSLFTVFNALALRPWPVADPGRVVTIQGVTKSGHGFHGLSSPEYRYLREHAKTISGAILMRHEGVNLDRQTDGPRTSCHFVSGNYFSTLGVNMTLGRGFLDEEDRIDAPQPVAVLSHHVWRDRYGSDPHVVGRRIAINDVPFIVVGVASEEFTGTSPGAHDVWAPFSTLAAAWPANPEFKEIVTSPNWCCSDAAGRLADGVTREQAQAELTLLDGQYQSQRGDEPYKILLAGTAVMSRPDHKRQVIPMMAILLAAVGSVLLLACANVSNLQLARAAARQREIAVRLAIGAGRARIVRQLLTESLLLASMAGAVGLLLAYGLPGFLLNALVDEPVSLRFDPDLTVLAYTLGIAFLSAVAFGLAPALQATRVSVSDAMKRNSAHGGSRFPLRGVLLAVQVTISVVLLSGAALLARGLARTGSSDPGFNVNGVTLLDVNLPVSAYNDARGERFFQDLAEQLRPLASAEGVAMAAMPPLSNGRSSTGFSLPGQTTPNSEMALFQNVDAKYFDVLGIPLVAGRNFIPADQANHAIVINESMARRYWPGQNPVGQAIVTDHRREVVGVVRDAQVYGLGPVEPILFQPFSGGQHAILLLKGNAANIGWLKQTTAAIARQEARAIVAPRSLSEQMDQWLGSARMGAKVAAALGTLALLLATVGIYGVIAYSVEQRRREIGIRMALGAVPIGIVWFIVKANSRALLSGLLVGLALSMATSRILNGVLYGAGRIDPLAYGAVLALLFAAGVAASIVPARRAANTDPLVALHYE